MTTLNRTDLQSMSDIIATIKQLDLWEMPVEPEPLSGGITNANFRVVDGSKQYFVRAGEILRADGRDPNGLMQVFCRAKGLLCGVDESLELFKSTNADLIVIRSNNHIKPDTQILTQRNRKRNTYG